MLCYQIYVKPVYQTSMSGNIYKSHNADATAEILRNALKQIPKEATSFSKCVFVAVCGG